MLDFPKCHDCKSENLPEGEQIVEVPSLLKENFLLKKAMGKDSTCQLHLLCSCLTPNTHFTTEEPSQTYSFKSDGTSHIRTSKSVGKN